LLLAMGPVLSLVTFLQAAPRDAEPAPVVVPDAAEGAAADPAGETASKYPGMWPVPGTRTWIGVHGKIQLDILHDFDPILSADDFDPLAIPVGAAADVVDPSATNFSYRQTLLAVESRSEVEDGRIDGQFSVNLFGGDDENPALQVWEAYLKLDEMVAQGSLLFGQAFSTFVDQAALPNTLDYDGPNASTQLRQPLVRFSRRFGRAQLDASIEEPDSDVTNGENLTRWPDLVAAGQWNRSGGHLRVMVLLRQIRTRLDSADPVETALASGVSLSGVIPITEGDHLAFQVSAGDGIGRYWNDALPDGMIDPVTGRLDLIGHVGGFVSYQHGWTDELRSNLVLSRGQASFPDFAPPESPEEAAYAALNLIWRPWKPVDLGVELLWGDRENTDGERGTATRLQSSAIFRF
jgi:hypothetical protein